MKESATSELRCTVTVEISVSAQMFRRHDWLEGEALAGEVEMDVVDAYVEQRWQGEHVLDVQAGMASGRCAFERPTAKPGCTMRCELLIPPTLVPCGYDVEGVTQVVNVLNELSITCIGAGPQGHVRGSYMEMLSINAYPVPRISIRIDSMPLA
jgi:hypothetical protein